MSLTRVGFLNPTPVPQEYRAYIRPLGRLTLSGPQGTRAIIAEASVEGQLCYVVVPVTGMAPEAARALASRIVSRLTGALVGEVPPQLDVSRSAEAPLHPTLRVSPATLLRRGREWFHDDGPLLFPPHPDDVVFTPPGNLAELEVGGVPDLRVWDTEGAGFDLSRNAPLPTVNMRAGQRP